MTQLHLETHTFSSVKRQGVEITSAAHYLTLSRKGAGLTYAGSQTAHLQRLRRMGAFSLPLEVNYTGEVFKNSSLRPADWFCLENRTAELFSREVNSNPNARMIVASNAGNAPLHDWEMNYAADQIEPLAAKDFERPEKSHTERSYFCVIDSPERGVDIDYVRLTAEGRFKDQAIRVAVGGRPLIYKGQPVSLAEILWTSVTDPRHVLNLPEVEAGKSFLPIGLRSIQAAIRAEAAAEIVQRIRDGAYILIDLEKERPCLGDLTFEDLKPALEQYGYSESAGDYWLSEGILRLRVQPNSYRHTFWARRGDELIIGIINNNLREEGLDPSIKSLFKRVLKPVGLTIPELQDFLLNGLKAEEAVLMGNGKDPRLYVSEPPHDPTKVRAYSDSDVDAQGGAVTSGLLSVVIY